MKVKGKRVPKNIELNSEEMLQKLGARLKQLRIDAGFTSYETFAYQNNISRAQYGRYEKGQDIRFSTLIKLISAFGLTVHEFFSEGFD